MPVVTASGEAPVPAEVTVTAVLSPIFTAPSVPAMAVASVVSPSAPSAEPPVTWMVAAEPSWVVVSRSRPVPSSDEVTAAPAAVAALWTAVERVAGV